MLITFELKALQRSDGFQNYFKIKGYLPETSATAFTMQKVETLKYVSTVFSFIFQL